MKGGERVLGRKPGASLRASVDLTSLAAQGMMDLRDDNLGTPSCARLEGVWVPRMSGQAVTEHGTFCSVPSDDLHMCS